MHTLFFHVPFTGREVYLEHAPAEDRPAIYGHATHRTRPDLAAPGDFLLWLGRWHLVASRT